MIRNEQQYKKSLRTLADLQQELDRLGVAYADRDMLYELASAQVKRHIAELEGDIAAYQVAKSGQLGTVVTTLDPRSGKLEVGRALTQLRIAKGLSQKDLAQQIGTQQPAINRWESTDYEAYTLSDLRRVATVLGYDIDVVFLSREADEATRSEATRALYRSQGA